MLKIRHVFIVLAMLSYAATASAQLSIRFGTPHVSIGIHVPAYPRLVLVPGYPVYYAPGLDANFFFYDGWYWVYYDDYWYRSSWYDGPWVLVEPVFVPVFILRIPVRYYRRPPAYFRGWRADAPPRWGDRWGHDWEQHRSGWDRWDRGAVPAPAPLPAYQRQYSKDRYPRQEARQRELEQHNYRYQSRDPEVRRHAQERAAPRAPAGESRAAPQQQRREVQERVQQPAQGQREQRSARPQEREERQQGRDATREPRDGQGRGQDQDREHGRDRKH